MTIPRISDGTTLALGLAGGLAVAAAFSRRRRGSFQTLSEIQQRLLKIKNTYDGDPEIVIRAQDMVISLLGRAGESGLSGTGLPLEELEEDARVLAESPKATLVDYANVQNRMIRENTYYAGQDLMGRTHYAPLVPWIAREVARLVKESRKAAAQTSKGRKKATAPDQEKLIAELGEMRTKIPRIADWVSGARPNLLAFSVNQAAEASDAWHQQAEKQRSANAQKAIARAHAQGGRIVYRFPDGWTVNELYTKAHLQDESDRMHHCVGTAGNYWTGIERGDYKIFSMRDAAGKAMLTLTIRPGGEILHAKGHFDRTPGDWRPSYNAAARTPEAEIERQRTMAKMREILTDDLLMLECQHLAAYVRHLNPNARLSGGDLSLCGQKVAEAQRKRKEAERQARGQAAGQQRHGGVQGQGWAQEQGNGNRGWR